MSTTSQTECVQRLLASFPGRPFDQKILDDKVAQEVRKFQHASSQENVRSQWELVLRKEVFALAVRPRPAFLGIVGTQPDVTFFQATEGNALKAKNVDYYNGLQDRLDLVLTFTEQGSCTLEQRSGGHTESDIHTL